MESGHAVVLTPRRKQDQGTDTHFVACFRQRAEEGNGVVVVRDIVEDLLGTGDYHIEYESCLVRASFDESLVACGSEDGDDLGGSQGRPGLLVADEAIGDPACSDEGFRDCVAYVAVRSGHEDRLGFRSWHFTEVSE